MGELFNAIKGIRRPCWKYNAVAELTERWLHQLLNRENSSIKPTINIAESAAAIAGRRCVAEIITALVSWFTTELFYASLATLSKRAHSDEMGDKYYYIVICDIINCACGS